MNDDQTPQGTDEITPEIKKPEEQQPPAPAIDYEKKFAESARENQLLRERIAAEEKAQQELTKEPTDSDFRTAFPAWDLMSDTEKELARRTIAAERMAGTAAQTAQELKAERSWNTSIELALASNTALQGKEQAFQQYASRPQYRNVPMDVLVAAFLQSQGASSTPKPTPAPAPALLTGNGGPRTPEKPTTLSADQLTALRTSDEKAYIAYVKTHPIDIDSL